MPFQILSLSGGGYLGLYSATILAEIERQINRPLASCFDLIAGTSVGGILALGLAAGKSAKEIKNALEISGEDIFSARSAPTSALERIQDFSRGFFRSKYDAAGLRKAIIGVIDESTLMGELDCRVVVPAVNLTKGKPQVFKTDHHPDFKRDYRLRVVDVAMATSAAPTYFPIAEIGDELFADGGLFANSPDLIAVHEARHFLGIPDDDLVVLSIGTTTTQFSISHSGGLNRGIWGWHKNLAQTVISSQQMDVTYMLKHQLGDRYLRIDAIQSREQERDLGLDLANESAAKTIRALGSGSMQDFENDPLLRKIIEHRAPRPQFYHRTDANDQGSP